MGSMPFRRRLRRGFGLPVRRRRGGRDDSRNAIVLRGWDAEREVCLQRARELSRDELSERFRSNPLRELVK